MLQRISIADALNSGLHSDQLWPDEISELAEKFGPTDFYSAAIDLGADYFNQWRYVLMDKKDRRGEAALLVQNESRQILFHTKPFYPAGVYRIPTGGIKRDEKVIDGMHRELEEETGFRPLFYQFKALLLYEFRHENDRLPFASYIFRIKPDGNEPQAGDPDEQISGFVWRGKSGLVAAIERLYALDGQRWQDWGRVRAAPHEIIAGDMQD